MAQSYFPGGAYESVLQTASRRFSGVKRVDVRRCAKFREDNSTVADTVI